MSIDVTAVAEVAKVTVSVAEFARLKAKADRWDNEVRLRRTRHLRRQEKRKRMNALVKAELAAMVERGKPHLQPRENES